MKAKTVPTLVHSTEEIQALLRRGLTPITDNRDGLIELGFEPVAPEAAGSRADSVWERSADHPGRAASGMRMLVRQRAVLTKRAA